MVRIRSLVVAFFLATAVVLGVGAPQAHAAGAPITRMEFDIQAAADGTFNVTQTFDMDFGTSGGHGPYLYYVTRQDIQGDSQHRRVLSYNNFRVSSPSGAPANAQTESKDGTLALRIGDANVTVRGVQTYVVTYRLTGVVNPKVASSGMDEVFYNIIGTGFVVPISNVTVRLTGPAAVSQTQCWQGSTFSSACTSATQSGSTATFTQTRLNSGDGLAIVAGWPAGTFSATPQLERIPAGPFEITPVTAGGAGLLTVGALGLLVMLSRRGRDDAYAGLTPGLVPGRGQEGTIGKRDEKTPVAVQFTPPKGLAPGMIGTLIDETADPEDVTATIVDMAVRGYLRFEKVGAEENDVRLVRLQPPNGLLPYEKNLYDALWESGDVVSFDDLEDRSFGQKIKLAQGNLYDAVTKAGWFKGNPSFVRSRYVVFGTTILALMFFGVPLLMGFGLGLLAIPIGVLALGLLVISRRMPVRTADGSAVLAQAEGFRQYLETAEADQIKFEEGQDIFSRYLPYAIAFGCADRWAKVFADLAARGVNVPMPTWYVGPGWGYGVPMNMVDAVSGFETLTETLDGFSQSAASAMSAASAGSSGGSGFSSGGFSGGGGGGVGGGGGGSW